MCNRTRFLMVFVLLVAIFGCNTVFADDGAMRNVSGGSVELMKDHPTIQMVSESVDLKLGEQVGWKWPVFVRCEFILKNNGPATDVNIGFPEHSFSDGDGVASGRLMGFKSWVDGKPVKVKYVPSGMNKLVGRNCYLDYKAWYVKKVHFAANQTRRIVDVYSARLGGRGSIGSANVDLLTYVLRSGASWHGSIGSAVIRADLSAAEDYYKITATPKGFARKKNILVWKFKNLEPEEDIEIELAPKTPLINGKEAEWLWYVFFVRNGVLMVSPGFLGGDIEKKQWTFHHGRHTLVMAAGSKTAILDKKKIRLKTAPWKSKEDSDCAIPLEETVHLLGGTVKYDANHRPNIVLKGLKAESYQY